MANPYPADFEAVDGTVRLSGQLDFTDPSNQPGGSSVDVTAECTLEASGPVDAGNGRVKWDTIYDFDQNSVAAIPTNMGMTLSVDTTTITTTEPGIWIVKLVMNPLADVTAKVRVLMEFPDYAGGPRIVDMDVSITGVLEWCLPWPGAIKTGGVIRVTPASSGATAPGYVPWGYGTLGITRFA